MAKGERLTRFDNHQRVLVVEGKLAGRVGTVVRKRISDNGAWVDMDEKLPKGVQSFDAGDPREKRALLYPDQCVASV